MSWLPAYLRILRPLNIILTLISVFLGGWLSSRSISMDLVIAGLSASLIAAFGYIHNDIIDLRVDRISHPKRPVPSGAVSIRSAWILTTLAGTVGLCLSALLPAPCLIAAALITLLLTLYNTNLKRLPLVGNLSVCLIGGSPFLFGGLAAGNATPTLLPTAFAVIFHFAREIVKDIQDQSGDAITASRALPAVIGTRASKSLVSLLLGFLIITIPLPAFYLFQGPVYLSLILILNGLILLTICEVWSIQSDRDLQRPSSMLKVGMFIGISAFYLDALLG